MGKMFLVVFVLMKIRLVMVLPFVGILRLTVRVTIFKMMLCLMLIMFLLVYFLKSLHFLVMIVVMMSFILSFSFVVILFAVQSAGHFTIFLERCQLSRVFLLNIRKVVFC
uniref:Uncharacterized protein n=1 Tax=Octopus bimaculoides TaxID=37653 RepID=A0A0L8FFY3_OCTBM